MCTGVSNIAAVQVDKLGEEIRLLERKLKQSMSEQEHLNGHNTYLNTELDRWVAQHCTAILP